MCRSPFLRAGCALIALLALVGPVHGADANTFDEDAVRALLATLEDGEARTRLVETLETMLAASQVSADSEQASADGIGTVADLLLSFGERFQKGVSAWLDAPEGAIAIAQDTRTPSRIEDFFFSLLFLLAAAVLAWLTARLLRPAKRRFEAVHGEPWNAHLLAWAGRTVVEILPIVVFFSSSHILLPTLDASAPVLETVRTAAAAIALLALALALGRAAFAPRVPEIRPFAFANATAVQGYLWVQRFAWLGVGGGGLLVLLSSAIEGPGLDLLRWIHGILIAALATALVQRIRKPVANRIGGKGRPIRQRFAETWHIFAILYITSLTVAWLLGFADGEDLMVRGVLAVVATLGVGVLAEVGATLVLRRLARLNPFANEGLGTDIPSSRSGLAGPRAVASALIWLIAISALLQIWNLDALPWIASETGRGILIGTVRVLLFALGTLVLVEIVHGALSGILARASAKDSSSESPRRLRTLLPLAAMAMRVTALVIVVLVALSEFGVNIGPLLAGAGVVGIAVGFGAQTLVQDIITGLFILIEDSVAIGDVVRAAGHSGTVESLSLRAIRLRDLAGNVHTIPFSNVTTLENMTKGFSYAVLDVGVAYREDTDEVVRILEAVAQELRNDPDFSAAILDSLETLGVQELADSAVVVRIRIRTGPGKQWQVRRELNRRVKRAFDAQGIEIPFPHRTVLLEGGEGKETGEGEK